METKKSPSVSAPPDSLDDCSSALAAAQKEIATLRDKYLRAAAAIDNASKQAERVAEQRINQRLRNLFARMLEVADNLERALTYAATDDPVLPGLQATHQQLLQALSREGVTPVDVHPGVLFDPGTHEAVETREGDVTDMIVAEVRQPGYLFDGQVLRPARVVVIRPVQTNT